MIHKPFLEEGVQSVAKSGFVAPPSSYTSKNPADPHELINFQ